ncbi:MAG: S49 family peptidase, partial [Planctomycetota bacterium]
MSGFARWAGFSLALLLSVGFVAQARAEKTLLRVRLEGQVLESPSDAAGLLALFEDAQFKTLREYAQLIRSAAADRDIHGLALILDEPQLNLAQVEELTAALASFKAKNKPIYCYMDQAGNVTYPLAAAATHITLAENSTLDIVGLYGQMMFFKGLLDKIGVEADMLHIGAYKSALEPFTRTEPSPEAAENVNWLLDSIYERWVQLIADGRKLSPEQVKKIVDTAPLTAAEALEHKLVDAVGSFEDFQKALRKEFGQDLTTVKSVEEMDAPDLKSDDIWGLLQKFQAFFE